MTLPLCFFAFIKCRLVNLMLNGKLNQSFCWFCYESILNAKKQQKQHKDTHIMCSCKSVFLIRICFLLDAAAVLTCNICQYPCTWMRLHSTKEKVLLFFMLLLCQGLLKSRGTKKFLVKINVTHYPSAFQAVPT